MNENMNNNLIELKKQETIRSKKDIILSLFNSGTSEIEAISAISGAKPSYVGSVLQQAGLIDNYFDLYTSTALPMNVYSKHFRGKLGFKDVETAQKSVRNLEQSYHYFANQQVFCQFSIRHNHTKIFTSSCRWLIFSNKYSRW